MTRQKAAMKRSEDIRELTQEEIAAVAGGLTMSSNSGNNAFAGTFCLGLGFAYNGLLSQVVSVLFGLNCGCNTKVW